VTERWLRETGSSAGALFEDAARLGFQAFVPHLVRRPFRWGLELRAAPAPLPALQYDVVFGRTDELRHWATGRHSVIRVDCVATARQLPRSRTQTER